MISILKQLKLGFSLLLLSIITSSCEEEKFGKITLFIDQYLFDETIELFVNDKLLTPEDQYGISIYSIDNNVSSVKVDFTVSYEGTTYSSYDIPGAIKVSPLTFSPHSDDIAPDTRYYEITPTGDSSNPLYAREMESSTDTGGGSGGGGNCDLSNYAGPEFNLQIDSQCKAAYLYQCGGNEQGRQSACAIYNSYMSQGNIPNCPYCN